MFFTTTIAININIIIISNNSNLIIIIINGLIVQTWCLSIMSSSQRNPQAVNVFVIVLEIHSSRKFIKTRACYWHTRTYANLLNYYDDFAHSFLCEIPLTQPTFEHSHRHQLFKTAQPTINVFLKKLQCKLKMLYNRHYCQCKIPVILLILNKHM